ncbi:4-hydroxy-3-methylbut-2-enyl diphosphate reductase [Rickettsiales bacterium LUAb2]
MNQKSLDIFLLAPRGFCAGVERAVNTVEEAIKNFGVPVYVKHQIVHNKRIIDDFIQRGVVFINDLSEVPDNSVLIFNAHGVTKEFETSARARNIQCIDATCPLVKKVHREAAVHLNNNNKILIIGHKDHPEVIATKSRVGNDAIVIDDTNEANNFIALPNVQYAFVTQTTLSVDYINEITDILKQKIPTLISSKNICYATQNRQDAIKHVIDKIDGLIVVGSQNSSNSNRLKEIGDLNHIKSYLIDDIKDIPYQDLSTMQAIAVSAGASSPSNLISEIVAKIQQKINCNIIPLEVLTENVKFVLPKIKSN